MSCTKCDNPSVHALQIRDGDPTRVGKSPDRSRLLVVRLCEDHWQETKQFLGL